MKLEIDIPNENIANVLCSGFESGIGYWARDMSPSISPTRLAKCQASAVFCGKPLKPGDFFLSYFFPMYGGKIAFFEAYEEGDGTKKGPKVVINAETLARGLQLMASHHGKHFGDLMSGDSDSVTGDVLIQICALGEVRYG